MAKYLAHTFDEQTRKNLQTFVKRRIVANRAQRRKPCRHRQRITGERPGMEDFAVGGKLRHNLGASAESADGQAAADDLAQRRQVGADAEPFLRSSAGDAKAGHHFIENQQRIVSVADRAQSRQKLGARRDVSHVADERLDDNRRNLFATFGKDRAHRIDIVIRNDDGIGCRAARNARRVRNPERQRARPGRDEKHIGGAVIAAGKLDDLCAAGNAASKTNRAHRRFGAA